MKGIDPANIQFLTLPGHYRTQDGRVEMDPVAAGVIWNHLKSDTLLDGSNASGTSASAPATTAPSTSAPATSSAPPAPSISPSTISVRVENGTTVTGLATDVTTSLQAQGYDAVISHTIPPHTAVTTIDLPQLPRRGQGQAAGHAVPGREGRRGRHRLTRSSWSSATTTPRRTRSAARLRHRRPGQRLDRPGRDAGAGTGTLPTDIANNSRTADQDICSGITAGYGAGTG